MVDSTDSTLKRLNALFRGLVGNDISMATFSNRLCLQKAIYILKSIGENFDYSFDWYHRGVYSTQLAGDGFEAWQSIARKDDISCQLSENEKNSIGKARMLMSGKINESSLELFSSIIYLVKEGGTKEENVTEKILLLKPWFSPKEINDALAKLKKFGYI